MDVHDRRPAAPPRFVSSCPCPSCGATIGVDNAEAANCSFCGWAGPPPVGAWQGQAIDELIADTLKQGRSEIRNTLAGKGALASEPAAVLASIIVAACVGVWLYPVSHALAWLLGFVVLVVLSIGMMIAAGSIGQRFATRRAARIARELELSQRDAKCTNCGAPVVVPGGMASFTCAHCQATLLSAEGMLVTWAADGQAARAAWHEQAARIAERTTSIADRVGGLLITLFFAGILVATFGYLAFTAVS